MTSATETQGNEAGDVLQFYDSKLVNLSESSSLLAIMMAMSEYAFGASIATSSRLSVVKLKWTLGLRLGGWPDVAVAASTASQDYNLPQMLVRMFVMLSVREYIQKKVRTSIANLAGGEQAAQEDDGM